jgi:hypothetical protein
MSRDHKRVALAARLAAVLLILSISMHPADARTPRSIMTSQDWLRLVDSSRTGRQLRVSCCWLPDTLATGCLQPPKLLADHHHCLLLATVPAVQYATGTACPSNTGYRPILRSSTSPPSGAVSYKNLTSLGWAVPATTRPPLTNDKVASPYTSMEDFYSVMVSLDVTELHMHALCCCIRAAAAG